MYSGDHMATGKNRLGVFLAKRRYLKFAYLPVQFASA
jgi:hypothetical protein